MEFAIAPKLTEPSRTLKIGHENQEGDLERLSERNHVLATENVREEVR